MFLTQTEEQTLSSLDNLIDWYKLHGKVVKQIAVSKR